MFLDPRAVGWGGGGGFLNCGIEILGWIILCCGGCPEECRLFISISGLYQLDVKSTVTQPPHLCQPKTSPGVLQARMLEWVCHFLLQGIFPTRGLNCISCIVRWILYGCTTREDYKDVPRHCQMSPGGKNCPCLGTTELGGFKSLQMIGTCIPPHLILYEWIN